MAQYWNILIELLLLGFCAFLYYLWQKKRIIKNSKIFLYSQVEDIIYQLKNIPHLETFKTELQNANDSQDYALIKEILRKIENEDLNWPKDIFQELDFHLDRQ